jgi:hypothetical protein
MSNVYYVQIGTFYLPPIVINKKYYTISVEFYLQSCQIHHNHFHEQEKGYHMVNRALVKVSGYNTTV